MSRRSLLVSQVGSSLRSDPDLEDDRGSTIGRNRELADILALLPAHDKSFDNLSVNSEELSVFSHPFSEDTPRFPDAGPSGQFSEPYREVMRALRPQTGTASVCSTCSSCDTCSTDTWEALGIDEAKIYRVTPRPLPAGLEKQIQEKLNEVSVERPPRSQSRSRSRRSQESGGGGVTGEESLRTSRHTDRDRHTQTTYHDNMSGLWNMLATYDEFVVTPPGWNVYQQEKPHWLDQEPIPWSEREKARRKCVKWLKTSHF